MYMLIKSGFVSMYELKNVYTLSEALKLYALWRCDMDIQSAQMAEIREGD